MTHANRPHPQHASARRRRAYDAVVAAYVNVHYRAGAAHLSYLFVDPPYQGRGLGTQLMKRALDHARQSGYGRATLGVAVENESARRFYERAGWKDTGVRTRHRRLGLDMAEYARDLKAP